MSTTTEVPKDARLDLRMTHEARAVIGEAASLTGASMTDYVLGIVLPAARRDVIESRTIALSREAWTDFLDILDRPDNPSLAALRDRTPEWGAERA
jgi:uncharacterized protein (DUF1778 family)